MNLLTSRGFAIFILCVCLAILILVNAYPFVYSRLLLIVPALLFVSIAFCAGKRFFHKSGKRDIRFLGSIVFHAGMLVVIAVTAIGFLIRFFAVFELPQDIDVNMDNTQFVSIHSTPLGGHVPFLSMKLNWQKTKYEKEIYPVEHAVGVTIDMLGEVSYEKVERVIKVNAPVWLDGYQFMLADGRLSPLLVLKDSKGTVIFNSFVNIPNSIDSEETLIIKDTGLTLYMRFFPDMYKEDGKYGTRSTQPKNPAIGIKVAKNEDPFKNVWSGMLKAGEKAEFEGMTLEFAELKPVATVYVSKDSSYWGIFAGWGLIMAGLVIRYLTYARNPRHDK
ncbi:MAG: cytochrome c biogenesis protein ResB [Thermodesulfobacteriota bacterium]